MVDYASKRIVFTMNFVNASLNGKIILYRYFFFISIVIFSSTHRSLVWSVASGDRSLVCTWTISRLSRNRCDDIYEDFIKSFLGNCAEASLCVRGTSVRTSMNETAQYYRSYHSLPRLFAFSSLVLLLLSPRDSRLHKRESYKLRAHVHTTRLYLARQRECVDDNDNADRAAGRVDKRFRKSWPVSSGIPSVGEFDSCWAWGYVLATGCRRLV